MPGTTGWASSLVMAERGGDRGDADPLSIMGIQGRGPTMGKNGTAVEPLHGLLLREYGG